MLDARWCEYELIGAVLLNGRKCLNRISDILKPEYFAIYELSEVYSEFIRMDNAGREITSGSLVGSMAGRLTAEMKVEIARAAKSVCSLSALRDNAKHIADAWKMRQAQNIAAVFGQDEYDDVSQYIAMYADMLNAVAGSGDDSGVKPWSIVLESTRKEIFSPVSDKRITTGFHAFDHVLGGTDPTDFMVIAARPAVGKTAFKEQVVRHLAKAGKKILNVSLEMPDIQLGERQTAALSGVPLSDIRNRIASKGAEADIQKDKIEAAFDEMKDWTIDVYDSPNITPAQLTRLVRMKKYDVVTVDYGGLMRSDQKAANREQEMASISRGLRALALGCKIQVIALLQLNREVEHRSSKRVLMADLRESGQWEQDAVQILGLSPMEENRVLLEVLKNRNGALGTQVLYFDKPNMKFVELEERYEEPTRKARGIT